MDKDKVRKKGFWSEKVVLKKKIPKWKESDQIAPLSKEPETG